MALVFIIIVVPLLFTTAIGKIPIGTECGPTALPVAPDHPAANAKGWFYSDMAAGGFTYDWTPNLQGIGLHYPDSTDNTDFPTSWNLHHVTNFNHPETLAVYGLQSFLWPRPFHEIDTDWENPDRPWIRKWNSFDLALAWKSEWVDKQSDDPKVQIFGDDFFAPDLNSAPSPKVNNKMGRAAESDNDYEGYPAWVVASPSSNTRNKFIIGNNATDDTTLSTKWVPVRNDLRAFTVPDTCTISLLMYFDIADEAVEEYVGSDSALCTFYVNDGSGIQVFPIRYGDVHTAGAFEDWGWVDVPNASIRKNTRRDVTFALRWNGVHYSEDNETYWVPAAVAKIAYEQNRHKTLFPNGGNIPFGDIWDDVFLTGFRDDLQRVKNICLGFMGWEPWYYGYHAFKNLTGNLNLADIQQNYTFQSLYNGYGETATYPYMTEFLENTGMPALLIDPQPIRWKHWEYSHDGNGADEKSVQRCWDSLIVGHEWNAFRSELGYFANMGYRSAAKVAKDEGKQFWAGIQAYSYVTKTGGVWGKNLDEAGEPTSTDILCQGFLGMCFGAKGFFYSYYAPQALNESDPNWGNQQTLFTVETLDSRGGAPQVEQTVRFNGFKSTGLTTFRKNDSTEAITGNADLNFARGMSTNGSMVYKYEYGNEGTGVLVPNEKYFAAKEFNEYVHKIAPTYERLAWEDSQCAVEYITNDTATVGWVKNIRSSTDSSFATADPLDSTWVQVGLFRESIGNNNQVSRHFVLVNRRVDVNGGRWVKATLNTGNSGSYNRVKDVASGQMIAGGGYTTQTFQLYLNPGEGRLIHNHNTNSKEKYVSGTVKSLLIDTSAVVSPGATLYIAPGADIIFAPGASLTVYGKLVAIGKSDSLITFHSMNDSLPGEVVFAGSSSGLTDSLDYCVFSGLEQGLKVMVQRNLYINHCEFKDNVYEGLKITSNYNATILNSTFSNNGTDGAYITSGATNFSGSTFTRNEKNGLYLTGGGYNRTVNGCTFALNGNAYDIHPDANIRVMNGSPTLTGNNITLGAEYGIYGVSGAYPVMYVSSDSAKNTLSGNASHESYWASSYPSLSYGHNNFNTEDDTIFFFDSYTPYSFSAYKNYWGGGPPDTARSGYTGPISVYSINPSFTFYFNPYDTEVNDVDPEELFRTAFGLEKDDPAEAIKLYKAIVEEHSSAPASAIALERLFGLTPRQADAGPVREQALDQFRGYCSDLSVDRAKGDHLKWKAHRTALWAYAAQHRYNEAIRGFEAIVMNPPTVADSVFALIDLGLLHLEAKQWAEQDSGRQIQQVHFGKYPEIAPVSFQAHRAKTDTLLALLRSPLANQKRSILPTEFYLNQNYPNPFNSTTRITYGLPEAIDVKVKIYDVMGREVITLVNEKQVAGHYTKVWNGRNRSGVPVASGVYFTRIETPHFTKVKKMTLVK